MTLLDPEINSEFCMLIKIVLINNTIFASVACLKQASAWETSFPYSGKVPAKKTSPKTRLVLLGAKLENKATMVVMADEVAMQKWHKGGHANVAMLMWPCKGGKAGVAQV